MGTQDKASGPDQIADLQARIAELESRLATTVRERDTAIRDLEWWRKLIEASPHFISVFDDQLAYCYLNYRADDFGDESIMGRSIREFVSPANADLAEAAFRQTLETGQPTQFEVLDRDHKHWYVCDVTRVVLDDGRRFVQSTSQNIDRRKQTAAELRDTQALWNSLVANSPDIILLLERDAKVLSINRTVAGYTPEGLIGHYGYEFVVPEYREEMRRAIVAAVDTGKPQHYEMRDIVNQMWWWVTLVPVRTNAQSDLVLAISSDVTDNRRAQESVRASESRLRLVLDQAPAILWTTDVELRITSGSGAGLASLNLDPTTIVGKTISELLKQTDSTFPPLVAHRTALAGRSVTFEHQWREMAFQVHIEPLRDGSEQVVGTIGLALDITARHVAENEVRRARDELEQRVAERTAQLDEVNRSLLADIAERERIQHELRESEERFRIIAETVPVAVVITRRSDGLIRFVNRRAGELVTIPYQELLNRRSSEFYYDPEERAALVARLQSPTEMVDTELQLKRSDGSPVMVNVSYQPVVFDGEPAILTGFVDITRRMETELALRNERRLLKRLLELHERDRQLISYEIHDGIVQDMTAALMFFESSRPLETAHEPLSEAFENGVKLLRGSIHEARRLINGLRPPVLEDEGVVAGVEAFIEDLRENAGMQIDFHSDVKFQRLAPALEMAIYRIVQEGLNNVWHHSRSPRALVELVQRDDSIEIVVQDWGIGFDPSKVSKRRYGLMGVRERARLLNGRAEVDTKIGVGTTLKVELPLIDALMPTVE